MNDAKDWDPGAYDRFRDLRLRPALDLLAAVPGLPAGDVIDLGCGSGAVGPPLRTRYPDRCLTGVDTSAAMLAAARDTGVYDDLVCRDAAAYQPHAPAALVFSNALLQWLPHHTTLLPALVALLAPGGSLAIQMPDQQDAPSHVLLGRTARDLLPGGSDLAPRNVLGAAEYHRLLSPFGAVSVWHCDYLQHLPAVSHGHPVRHFTESTAMRPHIAGLPALLRAPFMAAYDNALSAAYPREPDGSVLFPFRRLFAVLVKAH